MDRDKRLSLVFLIFLDITILFPSSVFSLEGLKTYYNDDGYYITEGSVVVPVPVFLANRIISDYRHYNRWALKGMDGRDPISKEFIGILKDVRYLHPETLEVYYDVNLPWPFGMKDKSVRFAIDSSIYSGMDYIKMSFTMDQEAAALENSSLQFEVVGNERESEILFTFGLKFTPLVNLFFSLPSYKKNIEWRIIRVLKNFNTYAMSKNRTEELLQDRSDTSYAGRGGLLLGYFE